jgi:hypothetical protein
MQKQSEILFFIRTDEKFFSEYFLLRFSLIVISLNKSSIINGNDNLRFSFKKFFSKLINN